MTSADTYVMEKECTQGEFDYYTFETASGGRAVSDIVSKCSLGQKNIIMDDVESLARSWSTIICCSTRIFHTGLGKGSGYVSDIYRPLF